MIKLLKESLNLDSNGKKLKNSIKNIVVDSDDELREFVKSVVEEVISERHDDLNESYESKIYNVSVESDNDNGELLGFDSFSTNDPKEAINKWFEYNKKSPMMASISCMKKKDAIALNQYVIDNPGVLLDNTDDPDKVGYISSACKDKVKDNQRGFIESDDPDGVIMDQIYPFDVG